MLGFRDRITGTNRLRRRAGVEVRTRVFSVRVTVRGSGVGEVQGRDQGSDLSYHSRWR